MVNPLGCDFCLIFILFQIDDYAFIISRVKFNRQWWLGADDLLKLEPLAVQMCRYPILSFQNKLTAGIG
jgi:hypothetical protein